MHPGYRRGWCAPNLRETDYMATTGSDDQLLPRVALLVMAA